MRNIYAAIQRYSLAKLESREKMAATCILAMFTSDVTLPYIDCRR